MSGELPTRPTLLVRIRDLADRRAWDEFIELYQPVILRYLRRHGLAEADALDVAQETLHNVAKSIERFTYDRSKGSFRGWLLTIARRQLAQFHERTGRAVAPRGTGETSTHQLLATVPADDDESKRFERDCDEQALGWAMKQIEREFQPTTWKAFYSTAVENRGAQSVADELSMSVGAVYIAKSRVTARLRKLMEEIDADG